MMRHLNIVGENGSGKSTLARWIAGNIGCFEEISSSKLTSPFELGNTIESKPDVLIIECGFIVEKEMSVLKTMLTNDVIECHRKGQEPKIISTPRVIICSTEELELPENVLVIHLTKGG